MSHLIVDGPLAPRGFQRLVELNDARGLTPPPGARAALVQAVGAAVRWRDDGPDPTSAVGMRLPADHDLWYTGNLAALRLIEEEPTAEVNVSYYAG